ncbi:MAG: hypothetical protein ACM3SV_13280 [Betaproteobacteria bacterium]
MKKSPYPVEYIYFNFSYFRHTPMPTKLEDPICLQNAGGKPPPFPPYSGSPIFSANRPKKHEISRKKVRALRNRF